MSSRPDTRPMGGCLLWLGRFVLAVITLAVVTFLGGLYACQRQFAAAEREREAHERHRAEEWRARVDVEAPFRVFGRPASAEFERFVFDRCWRDTTPRMKPQAGMMGVTCTSTVVYFYGADDPTTATAEFEREARRLGSTPDTATWARPQPVPDLRPPDPTPPPGAGEQYGPLGGSGSSVYAEPVRWQHAYTEHPFVVRASVTIHYRTERTRPKPTPSHTPMFPRPPATCAGGNRPWSCL
ncbi:hypothetical protein ACFRCG_07065 [Embleya sp. NPDC056575]|uniref:hypothetical protein n=1 Tax=unclassified Embleya TaxID=2699296 RepID=UPI00368C58A9